MQTKSSSVVSMVVLAVLFGALFTPGLPAGDHYVSYAGSDLAGDGSVHNPWRTITHAMNTIPAPTVSETQTLHIGPGHWHCDAQEQFPVQVPQGVILKGAGIDVTYLSGSKANTRQPVSMYSQVLVKLQCPVSGPSTGIAPAEVTDMTLMHAGKGVEVTGDTTNVPSPRIHNCRFWLNQVGLTILNSAPLIEDCDFDSNNIGISAGRVTTSGVDMEFRHNRFYKNTYGINAANSMKMLVELNWFEQNGVGIMMGTVGLVTARPLIRNNTYYRNGQGYTGMAVLGGRMLPILAHETFYGNYTGIASMDDPVFGGRSNPDIRNSVIWGSIDWDLNGVSQEEIHNSNLSRATGVPYGPIIGVNGIMAEEPRFVDPEGGDLHLRSDSPLIDRGLNDYAGIPEVDVDGDSRSVGFPDIGSDEATTFLVHGRAGSLARELKLILTARGDPNFVYVLAASLIHDAKGGIRVDNRTIPLFPDDLFFATCGIFGGIPGFYGVLNGGGQALVRLNVPDLPHFSGKTWYLCFITLDPTAPGGIKTISNVLKVELDSL